MNYNLSSHYPVCKDGRDNKLKKLTKKIRNKRKFPQLWQQIIRVN